jgi:hypothetical protein
MNEVVNIPKLKFNGCLYIVVTDDSCKVLNYLLPAFKVTPMIIGCFKNKQILKKITVTLAYKTHDSSGFLSKITLGFYNLKSGHSKTSAFWSLESQFESLLPPLVTHAMFEGKLIECSVKQPSGACEVFFTLENALSNHLCLILI